jgi:hypothetical protein
MGTYSVLYHVSSHQEASRKNLLATKKITFKYLAYTLIQFLICLIFRFQLIWNLFFWALFFNVLSIRILLTRGLLMSDYEISGLFMRLNSLHNLLRFNLYLRYLILSLMEFFLWLIILIYPKIFPHFGIILLSLEEIDRLLGQFILLKLQMWFQLRYFFYLIIIKMSHASFKIYMINFIKYFL